MAYDVFVVAASEDREMAKLVVRRLRALKMRVYYDANNDDDTFTAKEAAKLEKADSVLVLWSKAGVVSNEVRAAASQAHSLVQQPLVQVTLDGTIPYDPFSALRLHSLKGFTTRTTTEGWFDVIHELEGYQGRTDLRQWIALKDGDEAGKAAWKVAHPDDPLSQEGRAFGVAASAGGADVAAVAAAGAGLAVGLAGRSAGVETRAAAVAPAVTVAQVAPVATTLSGRAVPSSATGMAMAAPAQSFGWSTILPILLGILAMLWLAWLWRTQEPRSPVAGMAGAGILTARSCPAGQIPRSMLRTLDTGVVVDDTGER